MFVFIVPWEMTKTTKVKNILHVKKHETMVQIQR